MSPKTIPNRFHVSASPKKVHAYHQMEKEADQLKVKLFTGVFLAALSAGAHDFFPIENSDNIANLMLKSASYGTFAGLGSVASIVHIVEDNVTHLGGAVFGGVAGSIASAVVGYSISGLGGGAVASLVGGALGGFAGVQIGHFFEVMHQLNHLEV